MVLTQVALREIEAEDRCCPDYVELLGDQIDQITTGFGRVVERAVERAMRS